MRRYLRSMLLVFFAWIGSQPPAVTAQDMVTKISETALNLMATAAGPEEGTRYHKVTMAIPIGESVELPAFDAWLGAGVYTSKPIYAYITIAEGPVPWSIRGARFEIKRGSVRFHCVVQASFIGLTFYRAVELPVAVYYDGRMGRLHFDIADTIVPIEFAIGGRAEVAAQLRPADHYSRYMIVDTPHPVSFQLPDGTAREISVSHDDIEVVIRDGEVLLKHFLNIE